VRERSRSAADAAIKMHFAAMPDRILQSVGWQNQRCGAPERVDAAATFIGKFL
jgi:hypothetical protein